jgi:hypothetical protein
MKTIRYSETSVLTRVTRHNILEDGMLHIPAVKTSNLITISSWKHRKPRKSLSHYNRHLAYIWKEYLPNTNRTTIVTSPWLASGDWKYHDHNLITWLVTNRQFRRNRSRLVIGKFSFRFSVRIPYILSDLFHCSPQCRTQGYYIFMSLIIFFLNEILLTWFYSHEN